MGQIASAAAAGKALATCRRVGVLVAAEYGRGAPWRQIGYLAARIARALGGGVAPQTVGANALAAVRLAAISQTVSLAEALSTDGAGATGSKPATIISIGCDVLGMLGWCCDGHPPRATIFAAAAALPNATTRAAELILPVTMTGEYAGTFLLDGAKPTGVSALLPGPAGVLSPAELVAALAREGGVHPPEDQVEADPAERIDPGPPGPAPGTPGEQSGPLLLLQRSASWCGCGTLTAHASWSGPTGPSQRAIDVRVSPQYAEKLKLANLAAVNVRVGSRSVPARVRVSPELSGETVVLPEGLAETRDLLPGRIDSETGAIISAPAAARLEK